MNVKVTVEMFSKDSAVWFIYNDIKALKRVLDQQKFNVSAEDLDYHMSRSEAVTFSKGLRAVIYFNFDPKKRPDLIAHEIFHAANGILTTAGVKLTEASEETYAYLIDYLTRGIYKKLYKKYENTL